MKHEFEMPASHVKRAMAREGRAHTFETIDSVRTALLVVDMQRYFVEPGYAGASPWGPEIVPTVNQVADALRRKGGIVVWLQMRAPSEPEDWSSLRERYSAEAAKARWGALAPADPGFDLAPGLDLHDEDLRVVKTRYSAFIRGSSDLDERLRNRGVDTVLVCGVATNACCESTARDAMMLDYRVLMVSDACAAATDEEHASALRNFYLYFGDVQTSAQVIALLS